MTDATPPLPRLTGPRRFGAMRSVVALMMREMATSYGRSPGGYLWAVIEPVATIAMLALAFSLLLKSPSIGTSFILFYATGYMPYQLFRNLSSKISQSFAFSKRLLAYPAISFIDPIIARTLVALLTQIMVSYVVFTGILTLVDTRSIPNVPLIALSFFMVVLLAVSVGMINAFLETRFPVWGVAWNVLTRPLLLASGVLYIYEELPAELQAVLWYNPLIHVVGTMRAGFYPTYRWDYVSLPYAFGFALVLGVIGLRLLSWYHRDMLQDT